MTNRPTPGIPSESELTELFAAQDSAAFRRDAFGDWPRQTRAETHVLDWMAGNNVDPDIWKRTRIFSFAQLTSLAEFIREREYALGVSDEANRRIGLGEGCKYSDGLCAREEDYADSVTRRDKLREGRRSND